MNKKMIKSYGLVILTALTVMLVFVSCSSSEETTTATTSSFTIDGTSLTNNSYYQAPCADNASGQFLFSSATTGVYTAYVYSDSACATKNVLGGYDNSLLTDVTVTSTSGTMNSNTAYLVTFTAEDYGLSSSISCTSCQSYMYIGSDGTLVASPIKAAAAVDNYTVYTKTSTSL